MVSHTSWGFHWLTKKYVCHSLLLQPYWLYSDKLPLCKIHLTEPSVQWEFHGHRIIKFWMILGQSGSPVLIYAECEKVGLIDPVHPEFMSLELLFGFLYFLKSGHLNLVKIKISWASQYSYSFSLMLAYICFYFRLTMAQLTLFSLLELAYHLPLLSLIWTLSIHIPGYSLHWTHTTT